MQALLDQRASSGSQWLSCAIYIILSLISTLLFYFPGTLVLTRDAQGRQKYVRTRRVTALGFEPIMDVIKMEHEREILLDWVARNKPRRRNRTLSVPGIDFNYGASGIGSGSGVYGMQEDRSPLRRMARPRSHTLSPRVTPRDAPDSV